MAVMQEEVRMEEHTEATPRGVKAPGFATTTQFLKIRMIASHSHNLVMPGNTQNGLQQSTAPAASASRACRPDYLLALLNRTLPGWVTTQGRKYIRRQAPL